MEMGVLVHTQLGLRFGAALPGAFFSQKNSTFDKKNMIFHDFQMIFHQNEPNLLLTRGATIKTGILTLIEFWWVLVTSIPEMVVTESSHDRSCSKESSKNLPSTIAISDPVKSLQRASATHSLVGLTAKNHCISSY